MSKQQANQVVIKQFDEQKLPAYKPDVTIVVNENVKEQILNYTIIDKNGPSKSMELPAPPAVPPFWEELFSLLDNVVRLGGLNAQEKEGIWLQLKGVGRHFYDSFIQGEMRTRAMQWQEGMVIAIESNEQRIPWELIYDGDYFWGQKFIIARSPVIFDKLPNEDLCHQHEKSDGHTVHKVTNVIGGGLRRTAQSRILNFFNQLGEPIQIVHQNHGALNIAEVADSTNQADIIHFTCHGHRTPLSLQLGGFAPPSHKAVIGSLYPFTVAVLGDIRHSIVFANACNSSAPTSFLGETLTFGWEFYCKGVDAYIGSLGLLPTNYAIAFAEDFYRYFFDGKSVGVSLHQAKQKAISQSHNPFWLLYCLYGDPFASKRLPTVH